MSNAKDAVFNATGGYGKPPKSGQFQKGQSGNPNGRPKKPKPQSLSYNPADYPTRKIIRDEAQRAVAIRDGDARREIPSSQAVMMALANAAMKGGVLAQRTYLKLQMAEDERRRAEQQEDFDFWSQRKRDGQAQLDAAAKSGIEPPEILPHPADIELSYVTLEVKILGACNKADRDQELKRANLRDLFFELSIYYNEDNLKVDDDDEASSIGVYMTLYLSAELNLPPSLKLPAKVLCERIMPSVSGRYHWSLDLERRCQEADLPFEYCRDGKKGSRSFSLSKLGFGWRDDELVPVDPKIIRKRDAMLRERRLL